MKYTGYNPNFIEEMPSHIWKRLVREATQAVAKHTPFKDIDKLLQMTDYNDVLKLIFSTVVNLESAKDIEYIREFSNNFSVLYALETSFEFVVDLDKYNNISEIQVDALKTFNMPFEGMIINFKKGDLYSSSFISCVELTEKYYKENEPHKVYIVKESAVTKDDNRWKYGVVNEYSFIPVLAPRVFLNCALANQGCPNFVQTGVESHIRLGNSTSPLVTAGDRLCIKSPRTLENCPPNRPHINNKYIYPMLSIITDVLNVVNRQRSVNKVVREKMQATQSARKEGNKHSREELFIDLTKPIQRYVEGVPTGRRHGNHKSPKQHLRHAHIRRLKSGKEVVVKTTIVNRDNIEKVTYKI